MLERFSLIRVQNKLFSSKVQVSTLKAALLPWADKDFENGWRTGKIQIVPALHGRYDFVM